MSERSYPLSWPEGWPRTPATKRKSGSQFADWSIGSVLRDLLNELGRLRARDVVVSTNIELRHDGLPRSGQRRPDDGGAAVYWTQAGRPQCMACDLYVRPEHNLRAITLCVQALRTLERHGGGQILDRAFMGFAQLPPPSARDWRAVLGLAPGCSLSQAEAAYRDLAWMSHPDRPGGSNEAMVELNDAIEAARAELGERK